MRYLRMRKADFARWIKELDEAMKSLGADCFEFDKASEYRAAEPGYRFQTIYGPLTLHPSMPISYDGKRAIGYNATLYGRFSGDDHFPLTGNRFSRKWNFHLGDRRGDDITFAVCRIYNSIQRILPQQQEELAA